VLLAEIGLFSMAFGIVPPRWKSVASTCVVGCIWYWAWAVTEPANYRGWGRFGTQLLGFALVSNAALGAALPFAAARWLRDVGLVKTSDQQSQRADDMRLGVELLCYVGAGIFAIFAGVAGWAAHVEPLMQCALLFLAGSVVSTIFLLPAALLVLHSPRGWQGLFYWLGGFGAASTLLTMAYLLLLQFDMSSGGQGQHATRIDRTAEGLGQSLGLALGFSVVIAIALILSFSRGDRLLMRTSKQVAWSNALNSICE
jgi:hypothetical protein